MSESAGERRMPQSAGRRGGGALDSLPEPVRRLLVPAIVVVLAPSTRRPSPYLDDIPELGDPLPSVGTVVIMIVYMMMAVGLNVVVGYAGLLDLGYVAFYAAGAYTAAWLASVQFEQVTFHFGSVGVNPELPGIHMSVWLILILAGCFTALVGIIIGLPTLYPRRLPRDRDARLRRDHPAVRPERRQPEGVRPHARHVRDHADRLARDSARR